MNGSPDRNPAPAGPPRSPGAGTEPEARGRLRSALAAWPHLADTIHLQVLVHLRRAGKVRIEDFHRALGLPAADGEADYRPGGGLRWTPETREAAFAWIEEQAARHLTAEDVDDLVNYTRKRERAGALEDLVDLSVVPFHELRERLRAFCRVPLGRTRLSEAEVLGLRVALIRHVVSDNLDFVAVARRHIGIRDMEALLDRVLASEGGLGRIGGKAAGMFLAWHVLRGEYSPEADPSLNLKIPETLYLRSELYGEFVRSNGWKEFYLQKYKPIEEVRADYPFLRELFTNGRFPDFVSEGLRAWLERVGEHPLVVRSSSLLEDSRLAAFSGKYDSFFLGNQGPIEKRLQALQVAIAQVYASVLGPEPIEYRRLRNLLDYNEQMAVLVQKVVGVRYRRWFLPAFAGVAFSRNEYKWSPRIRKEDGLLRVVLGLGTRAVDRVGDDYPRMIALTSPTLRPQAAVRDVRRYSQRRVDAIDLEANRLETVALSDILDPAVPFPGLDLVVSEDRDGALCAPVGNSVTGPSADLVVTFDKFAASSGIPATMRRILKTLEKALGCPVDVEFAHDGTDLYLLQCRPLAKRLEQERVLVRRDVAPADRVFTARGDVPNASVRDVEYAVYVDPRAYDALPGTEPRHAVARAVGALNRALRGRRFILLGPGRWGSSDLRLGVPVRYGDIHNTLVLAEVAFRKGDQVPEVSFGTHFFQDLVEAGIHHLPLYPDDPSVVFREEFFTASPNALTSLAPDFAALEGVVRVVHVPSAAGGRLLHLEMDGEAEEALGYLR